MGNNGKHPRSQGLVMLSAWIDPVLRDHVRAKAIENDMSVSDFVSKACHRFMNQMDLERVVNVLEEIERRTS